MERPEVLGPVHSRRSLLKAVAGAAIAGVAGHPESSLALRNQSEQSSNDEIINFDTRFEDTTRPEIIRGIAKTRILEPHSSLETNRIVTPIDGASVNPEVENGDVILDEAMLYGIGIAHTAREEAEEIMSYGRPLEEWEFLQTALGQRIAAGGISEALPLEQIADLVKDPHFRVLMATYKDGETDINNFSFTEIAPQAGVEIEVAQDAEDEKPLVTWNNPGSGDINGFSPIAVEKTVIINGKEHNVNGLKMKIWVSDMSFSGFGVPEQYMLNWWYSNMLYNSFESAGLFVTPPQMRLYKSVSLAGAPNPYWEHDREFPRPITAYPELATRIQGPPDEWGYYNTRPILHMSTPETTTAGSDLNMDVSMKRLSHDTRDTGDTSKSIRSAQLSYLNQHFYTSSRRVV